MAFSAKKMFGCVALAAVQFACAPERSGLEYSQEVAAVRAMNKTEQQTDFSMLVEAFRTLYGPLHYKEKRFGFQFDDLVQEFREKLENAKGDEEYVGLLQQFVNRFQDGHVSLQVKVGDASVTYRIPLFIAPVEDKAIIFSIGDKALTESHGIDVGDEILEIDGVKPFDLLPIIKKYNTMGNEVSDRHYIFRALSRPAYMTELKPTRPSARLKIAKPSGGIIERELVWLVGKIEQTDIRPMVLGNSPLQDLVSPKAGEIIRQGGLNKMDGNEPFWLSPEAVKRMRLKRVKPSEEIFKKHAGSAKMPDLFAGLYRFDGESFGKGKTILLMRIGTYMPSSSSEIEAHVAWYKSLLEENKDLVDALVIDQTHNGGGYVSYAFEFASLFAKGQSRGVVNFLNADKRWLQSLAADSQVAAKDDKIKGETKSIVDLGYRLVEEAIDKGLRLTAQPVPFGETYFHIGSTGIGFDKPILMLVDELAGSCGDVVPMLMKDNGLATLFGERTAGWGGNVERVLSLPNSGADLRLTRGFFTTYSPEGKYDFENGMIENNGVQPDIKYQHTVKDVRAGYVDYVSAFSKAAVDLEK